MLSRIEEIWGYNPVCKVIPDIVHGVVGAQVEPFRQRRGARRGGTCFWMSASPAFDSVGAFEDAPRTCVSRPRASNCHARGEREFFIDNLLVRIHFISVMIRWTGLARWELEFPFPSSLASTFLVLPGDRSLATSSLRQVTPKSKAQQHDTQSRFKSSRDQMH